MVVVAVVAAVVVVDQSSEEVAHGRRVQSHLREAWARMMKVCMYAVRGGVYAVSKGEVDESMYATVRGGCVRSEGRVL